MEPAGKFFRLTDENTKEVIDLKRICSFSLLVLALILCLVPMATAESHAPIQPSADQSYAANLFLSNFTEIGLEAISMGSDDRALVDFAHDHLWFNDYESFEYGEYSGENNCRVADDRIQEIIDKYFDSPRTVDLTQTRFDYDGEYYYHCETGGWCSSGFALVTSITPLDSDEYFVSFMIFGSGNAWNNEALRLSIDQAWDKFDGPSGFGRAILRATDLADRSTYRMISYN